MSARGNTAKPRSSRVAGFCRNTLHTRMAPIAIKRFFIFSVVWLALTRGDPGGMLPGALAALAGTWLSLRMLPPHRQAIRLWPLLRMAPGFLWRSVAGGTDVAWRALHPQLPMRPGWRTCTSTLPAGGERVLLGGEFSLLPGTLVAGTRSGRFLVHCLDTNQVIEADIQRAEREIAACTGSTTSANRPQKDAV